MFFEEACDAVVDEDEDEDGGEDILRRGWRVLETAKVATSSRLPVDASSSSSCEGRRNRSMFVCFVQSQIEVSSLRNTADGGGGGHAAEAAGMQRRSVNNDGGRRRSEEERLATETADDDGNNPAYATLRSFVPGD